MTSGHGGWHAIAAAQAYGVETLFTLSGAHIFPLFDAAVGGKEAVDAAGDPRAAERGGPIRLVDVRHEATAVFAAEATAKLTRTPGFAAVTAGPGRHQRRQRPDQRLVQRRSRRGDGRALPRLPLGLRRAAGDGPPADRAVGHEVRGHRPRPRADRRHDRRRVRRRPPPRTAGRPSSTCRWTSSTHPSTPPTRHATSTPTAPRIRRRWRGSPGMLAGAQRPVLILGSDVWNDFAEDAAVRLAETAAVAGDPQRHGPRCGPLGAPAARHPGALPGAEEGRPGRGRGHAAGLPARLRQVRPGGCAGGGRARGRPPDAGLAPRRAGRLGGRRS